MKFISNLKKEIVEAAQEAVFEAEKIFGGGNGSVKKQAAIQFVTNALPLPPFLKNIVALFLGAFIDAAIETAVNAINAEKPTQRGNTEQEIPVI